MGHPTPRAPAILTSFLPWTEWERRLIYPGVATCNVDACTGQCPPPCSMLQLLQTVPQCGFLHATLVQERKL